MQATINPEVLVNTDVVALFKDLSEQAHVEPERKKKKYTIDTDYETFKTCEEIILEHLSKNESESSSGDDEEVNSHASAPSRRHPPATSCNGRNVISHHATQAANAQVKQEPTAAAESRYENQSASDRLREEHWSSPTKRQATDAATPQDDVDFDRHDSVPLLEHVDIDTDAWRYDAEVQEFDNCAPVDSQGFGNLSISAQHSSRSP